MKKRLLIALSFYCGIAYAQTKDYPIKPISFTNVKLNDKFWTSRIETNRTVTIPASFARCENTGRVKNFEMAAARSGKFCTKFPFDDTDIYKTIEGASYSMAVHPDTKLDAYVDSLITIIGKAQEPDGYLYTARTIDPLHPHAWSGPERWVKENELSHELYNSGHMFEAAAAHYLATNKRNFLDIALKNADLLVKTFGPGKRHVAPGHEIVEMGLVRLYRITGKKEYLDLAKFFIDERGHRTYDKTSTDEWKNGMYWQDNEPVIAQEDAEGHAVRAMYLYSGMADVAALTGDKEYIAAIDKIWNNMVGKKIYVQGGIGAVPGGERFGADYELPNTTAYNETCAAIGDVFWNQRMFLLHGESKYIDVMEKVLYNGLISGVGLDGKTFFYTNAMQVTNGVTHHELEPERSGWFECSCCPTNMARFLPSLSGYMYAQKDNNVFVNLFIAGTANMEIGNKKVSIVQSNNYPWNGALSFAVIPEVPTNFAIHIRIPGWARAEAIPSDLYAFQNKSAAKISLKLNGKAVAYKVENGYAVINRQWKKGDNIGLNLPMEVKKVIANKALVDDKGKTALQRGPIIYCAEWKDNGGTVSNLAIPANAAFKPVTEPNLLNGVTVLKGEILSKTKGEAAKKVELTAIPYYSWANRGKGEMTVWFPEVNAATK
ncbi:glycoside hydrolase family 127 protein [Mucilaginibacter gossypii]|uniref:glycoside hydrolase family 127 protein n=1 Tax=Mucilaginibacter gossypii TaxID=551996 RepID=UPI000DCDCE0D|nr:MULTISPECIES: glycoside hydrolase family 127 protein [Mucilaginibacter]QTE38171.1 glycoside hydrolase family 127 protein [Mucilaginibacter gossypii]RAV60354.1 glycoside hydrolase family 127 protein [Mucilaginibacter rubeus]